MSDLPLVVDVGVVQGRSGRVTHHLVAGDGGLVGSGPGPAERADLTVLLAPGDLARLARGELALDVAYMQGVAKVSGSTAHLLTLLELWRDPSWATAAGSVLQA
ncbi:MAG: SCP2 sterol-binding domain-containing protein [Acidimicrobiia bacterium]